MNGMMSYFMGYYMKNGLREKVISRIIYKKRDSIRE